MWQSCNFKDARYSAVEYKEEQGFLRIKCRIKSKYLPDGGKLYVHSGKTKMCVGTFVSEDDTLSIDKEYTTAYMASQGINTKLIDKFSAEDGTDVIVAHVSANNKDKTDTALLRAMEVLDSMSGDSDFSAEAESSRMLLNRALGDFSCVDLGFIEGYKWYKITDITVDFGLSSIAHILYTPEFMAAFRRHGCWYMGSSEIPECYAVGVFGDASGFNPMVNAADCTVKILSQPDNFYVVGIGLYDRGQYFFKLDYNSK